MFWIALYGIVALAASVTALLVAEWIREPGARGPEHPGFFAALAGLLWPAVMIGLVQWGLIAAVASPGRHAHHAAAAFGDVELTAASR